MSKFRANHELLDCAVSVPKLLCETATAGAEIVMGWGKCGAFGCHCDAYVSDSAHDGHCTCGHTAADHA